MTWFLGPSGGLAAPGVQNVLCAILVEFDDWLNNVLSTATKKIHTARFVAPPMPPPRLQLVDFSNVFDTRLF